MMRKAKAMTDGLEVVQSRAGALGMAAATWARAASHQAVGRVTLALLTMLLAWGSPARAQCPEGWLRGMDVPGVDQIVNALAVMPDGDVIVGGDFFVAGGVAAKCIARYNPNTGVWSALGSGLDNNPNLGVVNAIAVLPGGDLIVGGDFTTAGGVAANHIARYNPNTGVWSALGAGTNGSVYALAVLPGGDVIAGGSFTTVSGVATSRIARFNPTTGVWSSLGSGITGFGPANVRSLMVLPGGDLIAGGNFFNAGGVATNGIARYNPSTGVWSPLGTGIGTTVYALAVLSSGDVIAGGSFNTVGSVAASHIARYNPSTGVWSAMGSGTGSDVRALAVLSGEDVVAGGTFTTAGGVPASSIARYSTTTGTWSAMGSGTNNSVYSLAVLPGGELIVGGSFFAAGGVAVRDIARCNSTTNVWSALGSGMNSDVYALAALPAGDVIAGGTFTTAGGVAASRIARYNPTTGTWSAMGLGMNDYSVVALAVLSGGDVIAGGFFSTAGGVPASNIARYNPTTGAWSALGSGTDRAVYALAVLPGGDVIVSGDFTTAGGVPASNIARYNPATGAWSALGSGTDGPVDALAVLPGGDVIAGGFFSTAGGVPASKIARYNPTTGAWSALGAGMNDWVNAIAVLPDGDLIAGGWFTTAGSAAANYVARYNPTIGTWSALGSGTNGFVESLAVLPGGDVIVGGYGFTMAGGVAANRIARYKPTTGAWSALGAGLDGAHWHPYALAVLPVGDVIAGGSFSTAGGSVSSYFAHYTFGSFGGVVITTQPVAMSSFTSGSATFSVAASGIPPFTYSWRKGTTPIDTMANPSAATATLTIPILQASDAGDYSCVISNACSIATSNPATLSVRAWGLKFEVSDDGGATWKSSVTTSAPKSIKFRFGSYFVTGAKITTTDGTGNALALNRFTGQNQWVGMETGDTISGYTRSVPTGGSTLLFVSGSFMGGTTPTSFGSQLKQSLDPAIVENYAEICRGTLNIVSPTPRTLSLKNKQFGAGTAKGLTFYHDASLVNKQSGAPTDPVNRTDLQAAIEVVIDPCPGDFNHDNVVDDSDFVIFANAYDLLVCSDPAMPANCPSDMNVDTFVDDADFVLFAPAYDALVCP